MNTLFYPMAMAGMHPARREKIRINYCFKSSCEINETLRAPRWLKRSLTTLNRLFNHTQLELCVCSFLPLLNTVACTLHANRLRLAEMVEQMKNPSDNWMPTECDQSSCPSKETDDFQASCKTNYCGFCILCHFMPTVLWNFAIFVFLHSFSEDYAVQFFFLHPMLYEVCSERKQDFTLTVSLSLY